MGLWVDGRDNEYNLPQEQRVETQQANVGLILALRKISLISVEYGEEIYI